MVLGESGGAAEIMEVIRIITRRPANNTRLHDAWVQGVQIGGGNVRLLANAHFCLWLLIRLPYSKLIPIKVRLPGKRLRKSKRGGCKSSGDQVEFLRTTRLGPMLGMQRVMALVIALVLHPRVINGLWCAVTITTA